jgi:hypothetical protein
MPDLKWWGSPLPCRRGDFFNSQSRGKMGIELKTLGENDQLSELVRKYLKVASRPIEGLINVLWKS